MTSAEKEPQAQEENPHWLERKQIFLNYSSGFFFFLDTD